MAGNAMPDDAMLDNVGKAFSRLRRAVLHQVAEPLPRKELARTLILNLVDERPEGMTVGAVADQLSVDPSAASRMVSDCITAGYLRRGASQQDGRRTVLHLTEAGSELIEVFRRQQREAFENVTRDWQPAERVELARLLIKYVEDASR